MLVRAKPFVDVGQIIHQLHSCDPTSDEHVVRYEDRICKEIGVPYSAATVQGRAALLLALETLNVGRGDEVIVQSLICRQVVNAIMEVGATPVLVDSSIDDFNISHAHVVKKISKKTKAIIAVHLYGNPCDIKQIADTAAERDCYLIEDCAHTIRAKFAGRNVGTFGDLAFFSSSFDKPYSTGEGGILAVANEALIDRTAQVLRRHKRCSLDEEKRNVYGLLVQHLMTERISYTGSLSPDYGMNLVREDRRLYQLVDRLVSENASEAEFREDVCEYLTKSRGSRILIERLKTIGGYFLDDASCYRMRPRRSNVAGNKRVEKKDLLMGPLRAIVGGIALSSLPQVDRHRSEMTRLFETRLGHMNGYKLPVVSAEKEPTFLRYSILNSTRNPLSEISTAARRKGFELSNYCWSKPIHLIAPFDTLVSNRSELKVSEHIASNIINLPVHYYMNENDVNAIVALLERFNRP
jgi:dTDP-4-amino-4,6-dideoxygalactose transaminase